MAIGTPERFDAPYRPEGTLGEEASRHFTAENYTDAAGVAHLRLSLRVNAEAAQWERLSYQSEEAPLETVIP